MANKPLNLTGQIFGRLTVEERAGKNAHNGNSTWGCRCACGAYVIVDSQNLKKGITVSCGCVRKTHGLSRVPEYFAWATMIQRCTNPNAANYHLYGGRGVAVDPAWLQFENFLKDMGRRPPGLTLDRKDPNGNYTKSNCRWATWEVQAKNKRPKHV